MNLERQYIRQGLKRDRRPDVGRERKGMGNRRAPNPRARVILWKEKGVGKGSVAYADGHLYCRRESGKGAVALVDAAPGGYAEKGRFDQPDHRDKNSWAHPLVVGGRLYLRDQDVLLCYDVRTK